MESIPWAEDLLKVVSKEYLKEPPNCTKIALVESDLNYIQKLAEENDPFDELRLKKKTFQDLIKNKTKAWKTVSDLGEILYIGEDEPPVHIWWRCVRLLSKKPVRIVIFGNSNLRKMPHKGPVKPEHINGGYAMRCDGSSIVIYRREEVTRVLLHELLHVSCSDPYHKDTPEIEADTEAWAEIIQCAMIAKGQENRFIPLMKEQIEYSVNQSEILQKRHNVNERSDYAWRYAIGRLDVWRRLGLEVPSISNYKYINSLRLTLREPTA